MSENKAGRRGFTGCYLPIVEIKDYNVMTDGRNFLDQHVKMAVGHGDGYTTGCLSNYILKKIIS